VATTFQCLSPHFLSAESSTDDIIYQRAASLVATYFNDLSDSFTTQLLSFRALFKDDIKHTDSDGTSTFLGSQELLSATNVPGSVYGFSSVSHVASHSGY